MEPETVNPDQLPAFLHRLLPAVIPVLLVSIGYVDPGKWVATVEGGARFGADLVILILIFNLTAILCQYLSARIGLVTGRDLAKICSEEYDKATCVLLGVQTELSVIALDLAMTLGVAHALNLLFGVDLSTCVFLAAIDAVLFPIFATLLENHMARLLSICLVGLILLSYVFGVLVSQPEIPLPIQGILTKFSGDSAFALMSLLGANIMPHNFYLHSSIVRQRQGSSTVSKSSLCYDHLVAICCIFSGLFLANYVLLNSSATFFFSGDSTGLILLTFQDALSLMEQVFRSPAAPLAFFLVIFLSNQFKAQTWNIGGQVVLHDFLKLDIPGWLHQATIRIIGIAPALYCVWTSGAEGIYQLLIFTQVMVAMLLPSSVIPLFRVASSRPIMGVYKTTQVVDFLALGTFLGMLGLNFMFFAEMMFGQSDWVVNLRWNSGTSMSASYIVLIIIAGWSFCLTLWLAATPLKSASSGMDAQIWGWENQNVVPEPPMIHREANDFSITRYNREESVNEKEEEPIMAPGKNSVENDTKYDLDMPELPEESHEEFKSTTVEENLSIGRFPDPPVHYGNDNLSSKQPVPVSPIVNEVADNGIPETKTVKSESMEPVEKTVTSVKEDDDVDVWEPEEPSRSIPESISSFPSDGPSSLRSLSGKLGDETGNGPGSSRLAGLGRAARRQLASVLDEFWGQLYDFHGQSTLEAKAKRLDVLFGIESKTVSSSLKVDTSVKELGGYAPMNNSTLYDSPRKQQQRIISRPNHTQLMDAGERRYSSLRAPPSSDGWDYQPATVHGYQLASYVNRIANERNSDHLNNTQMEPPAPKSPSLGPANYRDSLAIALGQKMPNGISGISPAQASAYQSLAMSRNISLQTERLNTYNNVSSSSGSVDGGGAKKYHSLPDISGLLPQRGLPMNSQWDSSCGYGSSVNMSSLGGVRTGTSPLSNFDEHPATKAYRSTLPMGRSSIWSMQPYEQFGVSDKGNGQLRSNSVTQEAPISSVDPEAKLLQSFRHCIVKLLKLEGSDWLFRQNDGVDEDLIERVAARERFLYDAETREINQVAHISEQQYLSSQMKYGSVGPRSTDEAGICSFSSVPHCGEGCIWKTDLVISFGVWCIHRILDLSVMESRPELWGKYTYVLNRLQGVIDPAFSKPRSPSPPCFCVQIPASYQQKTTPPPISNGALPPPAKPPSRGKCTTAAVLLDIVKDVEIAISCRKGRTGTAAGDVAFPKGKENLASVLKRYKRRLAIKPAGIHDASGTRKVQPPPGFGL